MTMQGPEVEILLGLAGTFRRVPLAALAATLHLPIAPFRESTRRLVLSLLDRDHVSPDSSGAELVAEGGVGEGSEGPSPPRIPSVPTVRMVTVPPKIQTVSVGFGTVPSEPSEPSEPSDAPAREPPPTSALTAADLAASLDDIENLAFYETLVAKTGANALRTALAATLARRHELRGRPGAYFTAVLRRLTHSSKPYV